MVERYNKLFSLESDLFTSGSPILIAAGALLKDNQNGRIIAQLKFKSISPKRIKAVKVSILPLDTAGRHLGEAFAHDYLDLSIDRDSVFGQKEPIVMPDPSTRAFSAALTEVCFDDNSVWTSGETEWTSLPQPVKFDDPEMLRQSKIQFGEKAENLPLRAESVWICSCGAINDQSENHCHICGNKLADMIAVDIKSLEALKDKRLAEEAAEAKRRREEQKAAEERRKKDMEEAAEARKKKTKKLLSIILPAAAVVITALVLTFTVFIPAAKNSKAVERYDQAKALYEAGKYDEAIAAFEETNGYKDSVERIAECKEFLSLDMQYNYAMQLFSEENYAEAHDTFIMLDGYKDSNERVLACEDMLYGDQYNYALQLLNEENYAEASEVFMTLNGYKDSDKRIADCADLLYSDQYNHALQLVNDENYAEAYNIFMTLNGYKDSNERLIECKESCLAQKYELANSKNLQGKNFDSYILFSSLGNYNDSAERASKLYTQYVQSLVRAKEGDTVFFGHYEQDGFVANGAEPIEWLVLQKDYNKLFLISRYALDCEKYNNESIESSWATCSLRDWLNHSFVESAFGNKEAGMIENSRIKTDEKNGIDTTDRVFLLSQSEAVMYFDYLPFSKCEATDYAIAKKIQVTDGKVCRWWLRTYEGYSTAHLYGAKIINNSGGMHTESITNVYTGVRPAMWIRIDP